MWLVSWGAPWYGGQHIRAGGLRLKSQGGWRLNLINYLIIYLVSFIQFSFVYRLITITHDKIMCGRGACRCAKDDAAEQIIVLKFESFLSQQYPEETSRGCLWKRMVWFKLAIWINGQCQTWSNMEKNQKIMCIHKWSCLYHWKSIVMCNE